MSKKKLIFFVALSVAFTIAEAWPGDRLPQSGGSGKGGGGPTPPPSNPRHQYQDDDYVDSEEEEPMIPVARVAPQPRQPQPGPSGAGPSGAGPSGAGPRPRQPQPGPSGAVPRRVVPRYPLFPTQPPFQPVRAPSVEVTYEDPDVAERRMRRQREEYLDQEVRLCYE